MLNPKTRWNETNDIFRLLTYWLEINDILSKYWLIALCNQMLFEVMHRYDHQHRSTYTINECVCVYDVLFHLNVCWNNKQWSSYFGSRSISRSEIISSKCGQVSKEKEKTTNSQIHTQTVHGIYWRNENWSVQLNHKLASITLFQYSFDVCE